MKKSKNEGATLYRMLPYIYLLGDKIPTYTLCSGIGMIVSTIVLTNYLCDRILLRKYIKLILISLIGLILNARLFGIISKFTGEWYNNGIINIKSAFLNSGIVYIGGLIGFLGSLYVICKIKKKNMKEISNELAIVIPLFHSFGRIGCFFAGCCYGVKSHIFLSIPYRLNEDDIFVNRIPVQLYESCFEFILFVVFSNIYKNKIKENKAGDGRLLKYYIILYCIFRFFIEFFRDLQIKVKG